METNLKCKVVMVQDDRSNCVGLIKCIKDWKSLIVPEEDFAKVGDLSIGKNTSIGVFQYWQPQHLYFISDRKIKENTNTFSQGLNGDWYYNTKYKSIARTGDITEFDFKIEASTNHRLMNIPMISDSFLRKYVSSNGSINEVILEKSGYNEDSELIVCGESIFVKVYGNE